MSVPQPDDRETYQEREVKLAVDEDFELPPWRRLTGVEVDDRGERVLRSEYWDTDDLALAAAHLGVRHRDGVWTFKGPSHGDGDSVVREERELRAPPDRVPPALAEHVAAVAEPGQLHPVAVLSNRRHTQVVRDRHQEAEVVHDRVQVERGDEVVERFAEVEVEFTGPSAELADRLVALLVERGARVDPTGKYTRALRALGRQVNAGAPGGPGGAVRDHG